MQDQTAQPEAEAREGGGVRTTFDDWVTRNKITSRRVVDLCIGVCQELGLPETEAPVLKTVDEYRAGARPSLTAALILRHVTGGAVDLQHWVHDMINRPDYIAPRRRGPPAGKMAWAAELVAVGLSQSEAADIAECTRQAVSQYMSRHGLPQVSDERRREIGADLVKRGKTKADVARLLDGGTPAPSTRPTVARRSRSKSRGTHAS